MNHCTQTRARARMLYTYALGWAALLCLDCLPYSAAAQASVASLAAAERTLIAPARDTDISGYANGSESVNAEVAAEPARSLDTTAASGSAASSAAAASGNASHAESGGPGVVNINTADAAELTRLPRIGPARAQAILGLRAKLRQFSRIEQLLQVKGIGRATFRMLRPLLALSGPTTLEHKRGR